MNRNWGRFFAAFGACAGLLGAPGLLRADSPDDCASHEACGKAASMRALFRAGRAPSAGSFQDRDAFGDTDVLHNHLTLEVFPSTQTLAGTSSITMKSLVDGLTEFTFALGPALTPGQILVNGVAVAPPISVGTRTRTVTLDRPYALGETIVVSIPYSGPAPEALGGMIWRSQDGQPIASSFSEPFDAGLWWACKDSDFGLPGDNSDKATWELTLTHSAALTSVSNGTLLSTTPVAGGKVVSHWASSYPSSTYLNCFSLAKYHSWTLNYEGAALANSGPISFPLRFFLYSGSDTPVLRAAVESVAPMIDALRPIYGEYPFPAEGYGIYQFPFAGGMEHQTMTGQGNFHESVTIHEVGHQWWGNDVTCRTWHDIWLNEGFASYTEALWAERKPGSSGASDLRLYMSGLRPAIENVGGSVYCFDTTSETRIFDRDLTYKKAAWVVHMLRGLVGDEKFFEILAAWREAYSGSAATTDDFRAICEEVSGQSLEWFFDQWVYGGGAPTYAKGLWTFQLNGRYWTRFQVRQTQDPAWPVFVHPLLVRFSTPAGPVDHVVKPISRTNFFVRSSGPAGAGDLHFDPDQWVLNYGVVSEAPLHGPPVILEAIPAPGSTSIFGSSPDKITLEFSESVSLDQGQFLVTRADGSPVPFTLSYAPSTQIATLAFESGLSPGTYSLSLAGQPTSNITGQSLDGDVFAPLDPASFPTGDGEAGTTPSGAIIARIIVEAGSCPGDLNRDTMVDDADFVLFAGAYDELLTMRADLNGDGLTDDADFVLFAVAYNELLCP